MTILETSNCIVETTCSTIAVITNLLQIEVYDLRKLEQPLRTDDSNLSFNLRCIRCFPQEEGIGACFLTCRICCRLHRRPGQCPLFCGISRRVEQPSQVKERKSYCFKCHRRNENGTSFVYPVNALEVHPLYARYTCLN